MSCTARFRELKPMTVTDGASKPWVHIAPKGEFPGTISIPAGYDVPGFGVVDQASEVEGTTVLGDAQLEAIAQRFDGDILIDYEHFSHDADKSTEAAGWGQGIRYTAARDGLELETDWAAPARAQVIDKVYRYISPEFSGPVRYEDDTFKFYPSALTGAGLTNRPKLTTLRPVSVNRNTQPTTPPTMNHKAELLKRLGLPDTASDAEIQAALAKDGPKETSSTKCRDTEIDTLKAENKALRDEAITLDLERFGDVIEDKEAAKELLQLNRATAVKLFTAAQAKKTADAAASGAPATRNAPLYQKNRATPPDGLDHFSAPDAAQEAATAKFRSIEIRAQALVIERKMPFSAAFEAAKAEAGV